jgi:ethanolamine transporter EutH
MTPAKAIEPVPLQAELHPSPRLQADKRIRFDYLRWLKPENPLEKFGVTAAFLFVGGALIWLTLPESRFLILFGGQKRLVAMGILWWICAVPFGIFALAYGLHAGRRSVPYDKWMTKVHLGITFAWLIDFVRIVILAQWSLTSRLPDLLMDNYTFELYVLLGASVAMFFLNLRATARATAK